MFNRIPCPKDSSFCDNETDDKTIMIEDCLSTIRLLFSYKEYIIGTILIFIGICGFNIFRMITIQIYSTTHRILTDIIKSFLLWVFVSLIFHSYFQVKEVDTFRIIIIKAISYLIVFIGLIIFLEIVIINLCGLNKNTIQSIVRRTEIEDANINETI